MTAIILLGRIKKVNKNALIITDGTEVIKEIALLMTGAMPDYQVKVCPAQDFKGTDLLPADVFFIGCENSKPASFAYLEKMLLHINLASRKCGIFSAKEKTISCLRKMLKDCEADLGKPLLTTGAKKTEITKWIKGILK